MIPVLLALVGCGTGKDSGVPVAGASFRVDCVGMVPLVDGLQWGTPQVLQSDEGVQEGRRCYGFIGRGQIRDWDPGVHEATNSFAVRADGQVWHAQEGMVIEVEQSVGDFYLRGSYSGPFTGDDGSRAWGSGWLDLCDSTSRLDCPYNIEGATPYGFETSSRMLTAWGEGTACRAVIDRDTGALQVDLQAGVWNGTNITQLYRSTCPSREDTDPDWYRNRMTFKAGGVTGPGHYGPFKVTDFGGVQLPSLVWEVPPILVGSSARVPVEDAARLCNDTLGPYRLQTLPWSSYDGSVGVDSHCSYEIEDGSPGRVWIQCSEVRHDRLAPTEVSCSEYGPNCGPDCDASKGTCGAPFEWAGACDVVYRGGP